MMLSLHHKEKAKEYGIAAGIGLIASIPVVGNVAAELMGVAIPNKRMERMETMLNQFADKVTGLEEKAVQERMREPSFEELFEQGLYESARAIGKDRLEGIANLLASGVKPQSNATTLRSYLAIYSRLEDADLLLMEAIYQEDMQCQERNNKKLEEESIMSDEKGSISMIALSRLSHKFHNDLQIPDHVPFVSPLAQNSVQRLLTEKLIEPTNNRMPETYSLATLGASFMRKIKGKSIHLELA